jgi:hypothetical protein
MDSHSARVSPSLLGDRRRVRRTRTLQRFDGESMAAAYSAGTTEA